MKKVLSTWFIEEDDTDLLRFLIESSWGVMVVYKHHLNARIIRSPSTKEALLKKAELCMRKDGFTCRSEESLALHGRRDEHERWLFKSKAHGARNWHVFGGPKPEDLPARFAARAAQRLTDEIPDPGTPPVIKTL